MGPWIYAAYCKPLGLSFIGLSSNELKTTVSVNLSIAKKAKNPNKFQRALLQHGRQYFFFKGLLRSPDEKTAQLWKDQLIAHWNTIDDGLNSRLVSYEEVVDAIKQMGPEVQALSRAAFEEEARTTQRRYA